MNTCQDQNKNKDILRFAPSPTGEPHIGNIRTALINYIYTLSNQAEMKLRVEDTDKERSKNEYLDSMLKILKWIDIQYAGNPIIQSDRLIRHTELANSLLQDGKAYKCFCNSQISTNSEQIAECNCREKNQNQNDEFAIKLYIQKTGEITLRDHIKGEVTQKNENLQDIVLIRTDGSPTYMFCVVADDHDMDITLVIRGDDHLTNTFKQIHIYNAFEWSLPQFAHLPMLLAPNGSKLSKRNSVTNLQFYIDEGILPDALKNYLLLLSWKYERVQKANNIEVSEIFDMNMVKKFFSLDDIRKSPSKFDFQKLLSINSIYIAQTEDVTLLDIIENFTNKTITNRQIIINLMPELKKRSKTLKDLADMIRPYMYIFSNLDQSSFYDEIISPSEDCMQLICNSNHYMQEYFSQLKDINNWRSSALQDFTKEFASINNLKLVDIAQPLRVCITGTKVSPGIFEIMELFGRDEVLYRISRIIK